MLRTLIRRLALPLLALAIVAAGAWALWPRPVLVDLATIERGSLEVTVEDEGVTRIREVYTISAPTSGKMLRALRKVGDQVVAGQTVVAVIEPSDPAFMDIRTQRVNEAAVEAARAAVALGEAQLKQAEAQLEFARADLKRAADLAASQTISVRALDKAKLDVATAESSVASAAAALEVRRRELESARARLIQPGNVDTTEIGCCVQIRAPVSGTVLRLVAESEQVVQAGAPLIEVGDPADLEIAVDFLSRDAVRIPPAALAKIESWGGETVLNAKVRRVEPTAFTKVSALGIEEQRVKTILDFTDPPAQRRRLGHGYRVIARVVVSRQDDIPLVPLGALFRTGERWAVFVVKDGRARLRQVEIAQRNQHFARIGDGLREGERVVLHPSDRVQDGTAVAVRQ
jgi:HlyD family secretion protein